MQPERSPEGDRFRSINAVSCCFEVHKGFILNYFIGWGNRGQKTAKLMIVTPYAEEDALETARQL